jgi:hypothetical protein
LVYIDRRIEFQKRWNDNCMCLFVLMVKMDFCIPNFPIFFQPHKTKNESELNEKKKRETNILNEFKKILNFRCVYGNDEKG